MLMDKTYIFQLIFNMNDVENAYIHVKSFSKVLP